MVGYLGEQWGQIISKRRWGARLGKGDAVRGKGWEAGLKTRGVGLIYGEAEFNSFSFLIKRDCTRNFN